MDRVTPRSVFDLPVQVRDDGSVTVLTDSEQQDLHYDTDGTGWQGKSIPNSSISGSELATLSRSTGPRRTSATKEGAVIGCGTPPPLPHLLVCARRRAAAAAVAASTAAADGGLSDKRDNDDETFPTDAQLKLALRTVYARHRHDPTFTQSALMQNTETELGGADLSTRRHVINKTIALIKLEEVSAKMVRGRHDDGISARDNFVKGVVTGLGVPRDGVRASGTRVGLAILETSVTADDEFAEAAAAFVASLTDPANPRVNEFGACAVSGVCVEEPVAAAAPTEAAPVEAPAGPAPPPAPGMADTSPLRAIDVVVHDDDDNRHPEKGIEGRDGGLWDYDVADDDSELDDKEEETAPDDASATGHTYDDMTNSAPPHLRCVVLPLSSHHPSSGAPPRHYRFCCRRRPGVDAGSGRALGEAVTRLFGA